jgi:thiol-disulfide isomerase/thioredoxin
VYLKLLNFFFGCYNFSKQEVKMKKLLLVLLIIAGFAHAYRKNVLIENFTATWCPYCPYAAQAITQLESIYGESLTVIKYHPSTSDPFYHSHSVTRASYYNVPGLPTTVVSGNKAVVGGWNGVFTPLDNYVRQSFQEVAPCSIKVEILSFNPNTLVADARVKVFMTSDNSISIPSQLKLRVAILEDSIFYNWQNMNILRYVVRGMWPNAAGTSLTLGRGDSAIFNFSFSVPQLIRAPYYYVAAFVQQDSIYQIIEYNGSYTLNAGNVLQSGKARVTVNFGYLQAMFRGISDANNNRRFERNENGIINLALTSVAPFSDAHNVVLRIRSLNQYLSVLDTMFNYSVVPVNDTVEVPVQVQVGDFDNPQYAKLVLDYSWDGILSRVDTIQIKIGVDTVLVWDGSYDNSLKNYLKPFIDSLNFAYEWFSEADSGKPYLYNDYRTIFYVSGQRLPDNTDANLFISAINDGKNLIISGQNIAESFDTLNPSFLRDYLGVTFVAANTGDRKLKGTGTVFSTNDSVVIGGAGAYSNQTSKDVIEVVAGSGSLPILYYRALTGSDADSVAGVYRIHPSGSRIIFLGFGVEGVGTSGTYMTKRNFLATLFGINSSVGEQFGPSKFNTLFVKRGQLLKFDDNLSEVRFYSADGRLMDKVKVHNGVMDLSELKSGVYYLIYKSDKGYNKKRVVIIE